MQKPRILRKIGIARRRLARALKTFARKAINTANLWVPVATALLSACAG